MLVLLACDDSRPRNSDTGSGRVDGAALDAAEDLDASNTGYEEECENISARRDYDLCSQQRLACDSKACMIEQTQCLVVVAHNLGACYAMHRCPNMGRLYERVSGCESDFVVCLNGAVLPNEINECETMRSVCDYNAWHDEQPGRTIPPTCGP